MGLTNAERQARWRARRDAREKARPDVIEAELLQRAEAFLNYSHGTKNPVSDQERLVLADKLAGIAVAHLHRSQVFAWAARRLRILVRTT